MRLDRFGVADQAAGDEERGIFRVTTTEPLICAIIWDETEEFGNFNNSLAMNGTGIVDHDVFDVSSEFNDSFAATNAIDDSGLSEWSSDGDGDDASITIDLGESQELARVEFITRSMPDGTAIAETFTVTVDDGETFGPFPAGTPVEPNFAAIDASGQTLRFDVQESTGGNVGAVEVRVIGT